MECQDGILVSNCPSVVLLMKVISRRDCNRKIKFGTDEKVYSFAGTGSIATVVGWFILPEVARRTPAEIDELYVNPFLTLLHLSNNLTRLTFWVFLLFHSGLRKRSIHASSKATLQTSRSLTERRMRLLHEIWSIVRI